MGYQKGSTWEFQLRMVQLLEKREQNPSQISRNHYVTRSLLYYWWQLYREQGEAAFHPTQELLSPPPCLTFVHQAAEVRVLRSFPFHVRCFWCGGRW